MYPIVFSAPPSPARDPLARDIPSDAYPAVLPVVSGIANVGTSAGATPQALGMPLTRINQTEGIAPSPAPDDLTLNRQLRASVAYTAVLRLLAQDSTARPGLVLLEMIASDLKDLIRTGDVPSLNTYNNLRLACRAYAQAGPAYDRLNVAMAVLADNENASLEKLANADVVIARLIGSLVRAAAKSGDLPGGIAGSDELIHRLAACVTLEDAKDCLDQKVTECMPRNEGFGQWLVLWQLSIQNFITNPASRPNHFPVAAPWESAVEEFFKPAG